MSVKLKFEKNYFVLSFKNIALFLIIWLMTGFSLGTITLLGPVRWIVNFSKSVQFSQSIEDLLVKIIIGLFVLVSFYISLKIVKLAIYKFSAIGRAALYIMLLAITAMFVFLWMNPALIQFERGKVTEENYGNVKFVFGPYPTQEEFKKIKNENFTAVISLLHPAVVPFEPKLITDEERIAKQNNVELIEVPMLPWVSQNKDAIEEIKRIAETGKGKYYIHCYLGKDRVNVVRRVIQQYSSAEVETNDSLVRKLEDLGKFERGEFIKLDKDVYLTPFPTDDEFMGYVLNGYFRKVVSLLNPDNPQDTMWINREERICKNAMMPYELLPIKMKPYSPEKIFEITQKIKKMPRPLLIHAFLTKSPQTDIFVDAYKKNVPPLYGNLFRANMQRGKVELIASNIVIGPNPTKDEFSSYLYSKGIRNVLYIGDDRHAYARYDKLAVISSGMKWHSSKTINEDVLKMLHSGGTWFVYGLSNEEMAKLIRNDSKSADNKLLSTIY